MTDLVEFFTLFLNIFARKGLSMNKRLIVLLCLVTAVNGYATQNMFGEKNDISEESKKFMSELAETAQKDGGQTFSGMIDAFLNVRKKPCIQESREKMKDAFFKLIGRVRGSARSWFAEALKSMNDHQKHISFEICDHFEAIATDFRSVYNSLVEPRSEEEKQLILTGFKMRSMARLKAIEFYLGHLSRSAAKNTKLKKIGEKESETAKKLGKDFLDSIIADISDIKKMAVKSASKTARDSGK